MPFEKWESGEDLFTSIDREHDLLDRDVRAWAEECDHMQGIQIYTGGDDAWGGFGAKYAESLRDEFGKMAIWAWGIEDEPGKGQREKQLLRTLNTARTINEMSTHASMYIPLSIPSGALPQYVHLDRGSEWHSSALLATALETMTLSSRLRPHAPKRGLLGDLEAALNVNGNQRMAELQCSVMEPEADLPQSLTPHGQHDDRAPSSSNSLVVEDDQSEAICTSLDINLSGAAQRARSSIVQHRRDHHVFGAVEQGRGVKNTVDSQRTEDDEVSYAKKRRRFAGLPVVERFVGGNQYCRSGRN